MPRGFVLIVLTTLTFAPAALAQERTPVVIGERFVVPSAVLGEDRPLVVSLPPGYGDTQQRYPVLFLLDGPSNLKHVTGSNDVLVRSNRMPQMIVVGIGNTNRTLDLTPSRTEIAPGGGGADNFLRFIRTELIPYIDHNYRTHPYRVLIGHSFGAMFAMQALCNEPDMFNAYIAISPSLWWEDGAPVRRLSQFLADHPTCDRSLFVTMADEADITSHFNEMVSLLQSAAPETLRWDSMRLPDEDHSSTVVRAAYQGLKRSFADWSPGAALTERDLDLGAVRTHYQMLTARYGYPIKPPESRVNRLGYRLLRDDRHDAALETFKFNVEMHPQSAGVYDSLGEAYERRGQTDLAATNYERAVRLGEETSDRNLPVYRRNYERVRGNPNS